MSKITLLPHQVVQAIAAGEVIERPTMIIKELVENALDAEATQIEIQLLDSGLTSIVVKDNGQGIPFEELSLAVSRHATSKIASLSDLDRIQSLGFRGEALASIGNVANLRLVSRPADQPFGGSIQLNQSQVFPPEKVSSPLGTQVEVTDLFAQLPARRKFLKPAKTEQIQVARLLTAMALSHPTVSFTLTNNHQIVASYMATTQSVERLEACLQTPVAFWIPIKVENAFFTISGWLGKPQLARRSLSQQFWFINQRWIHQPLLSDQLKQSYASLLEPKAHPAAVIQIDIKPALIDVNVHPRKEMVTFLDEVQIMKLIDQAVTETLANQGLLYQIKSSGGLTLADSGASYPPLSSSQLDQPQTRKGSDLTTDTLHQLTTPWHPARSAELEVAQFLDTYLAVATPTGLLLLDQHAAHERIIFEQLKAAWKKQTTVEIQNLLTPVLLELNVEEFARLSNHLEMLTQLGFGLETFGTTSYRLTHLPSVLADRDPAKLIREIIDDLAYGRPVGTLDTLTERTMAYVACRSAVKAGDPLPPEQRRKLVQQLWHTPNKETCPHGRPTMLIWDKPELEKHFKRC